jgi:hypothetical protein
MRHKVTSPHNRRILLSAEPTTATLVVQHFMSSALRRAVLRDWVPVKRASSVATQNCRHDRVCKLCQRAPRSAGHPVRTKVLNWWSIPTNNWSLHPSYTGSGSLLSVGIHSFVCMIQFNQSIGQVFFLPARSYSVIYIIPSMFHCIQRDQLVWYIWTAGSHWTITMPSTMSHDLMAMLQSSRRGKQWVSHTGEQANKCLDRFQRKQITVTNIG